MRKEYDFEWIRLNLKKLGHHVEECCWVDEVYSVAHLWDVDSYSVEQE